RSEASIQKLAHRRDAMLRRRSEDRLAQRQRFEIVATADLRFGPLFERTEQLGHRADESIGKPHLIPARLYPLAGAARRRVVECAGDARGISGPADRAAGHALGALDPPANADVRGSALPCWTGPDVVPGRGAYAA